jgi:hypothetical protein
MGCRWYWDGWGVRGKLVFGVWPLLYWAAVADVTTVALVLSRRPLGGRRLSDIGRRPTIAADKVGAG